MRESRAEQSQGDEPGRGRVGLHLKIIGVLLVIALTPLLVSALLIDQIAEVAQNFASHEAERLRQPLGDAQKVYQELIDTKKRMYSHMVSQLSRAAGIDEAAGAAGEGGPGEAAPAGGDTRAFSEAVRRLMAEEPDLLRAILRRSGGGLVAEEKRELPGPDGPRQFREYPVSWPLSGGASVELVFAADVELLDRHRTVGRVLADSQRIDRVRSSLPRSYRLGFLMLVGGVVVLVTATGILLARRLTGRIAVLVSGTRRVASGDLDARVELSGRDELGELAGAFNRMVEDLKKDRQQILYLQRIGAWQDVARRLAHEIKNPLTPIQLAMQELVSIYSGDDPRYKKMLADAAEIVGEEINGLRRLIDAFSALGRLPPVEPRPLALAQLADDLGKDPQYAGRLELSAPADPVTVAGDRLLLRRLLANLIENGIHAGEAAGRPGRVTMRWSADLGLGIARVTIDDDGPGVAIADRDRIFEPYVTSKETGTGLGLAIAKKIALDHGGNLIADPRPAPTGGARFLLTLPLERRAAENEAPPPL
jgi:two-component system, NtrC family, nitrogen regulation sensor histidine kinase NtrY